jgi:pyruvate ferredoxin oxidoreductase gamma subunit
MSESTIEILWYGRGGQGCFTAARLLGAAAALYGGRCALAFPTFGPERRGAPVFGYTRIANRPISDRSEIAAADCAVVMDESLLSPSFWGRVRCGGTVLVNTRADHVTSAPTGIQVVPFDAATLAQKILGKPIVNTALLGALLGEESLIPLEAAEKAVAHEFRGQNAVLNGRLLREAYAHAARGIR